MSNTDMDKVGTYDFCAEPFHCDVTHKLFMSYLGNYMLNAAEHHSTDRGFGFACLNSQRKTWVLSRLAIEMSDMPMQFDRFKIETWVENAMRYFTNRNFRIVGNDGRVYGYGSSVWAIIDTDTRQPQDVIAVCDGEIANWTMPERECPIERCSRVKMSKDAPFVRTLDIHYSDIDINGHVNSIQYIKHAFDLFNVEWYRNHRIRRFEIAYVAETYPDDKLYFYRETVATTSENQRFCIRITKKTPSEERETEVCRCMIDFA